MKVLLCSVFNPWLLKAGVQPSYLDWEGYNGAWGFKFSNCGFSGGVLGEFRSYGLRAWRPGLVIGAHGHDNVRLLEGCCCPAPFVQTHKLNCLNTTHPLTPKPQAVLAPSST